MTDYERIKALRKHLKMSQTDFAESLGVTRGVITNIEAGLVEIKEYVLKLICSVYNVNEEWIKAGSGEMFTKSKDTILDELVLAHGLSDKERMIVQSFLELSSEGRAGVLEYVDNLVKLAAPQSTTPTHNDIIAKRIADTDKMIEQVTKTKIQT